MKDYPNITALAEGRVSGQVSEWPVLKQEAKKILLEHAIHLELIEDAFSQMAYACDDLSKHFGWVDTVYNGTTCNLGDVLVAAGLYEKSPDGHGTQQWYRRIEK